MSLDSLCLLRNILLRAALISYGFVIVMAIATIALWNTWTTWTQQWYHVNPEFMGPMIVIFFAVIKFYAIFLLLVPGLAIHWTIKASEAKAKSG